MAREDFTGRRYGRLLVLGYSHTANHSIHWLCRCDCGTEKAVTSSSLRRGNTVSCGCRKRDGLAAWRKAQGGLPHSERGPVYHSWANMMRRTTHKNDPRYADWGGRGITVCERWRKFENFAADMGTKPPGTTLDRIDNDGNYEPGNCRWATPAQQARNQRRAKLSPQKIEEIRNLYEQGLRISAISEAVGIRRHTVGTVCTVLEVLTR